MKHLIITLLSIFAFQVALSQTAEEQKEYKITFEVLYKSNKQLMALWEGTSTVNGSIAIAQQGKLISSGWKYTYRTTDTYNPVVLKVGTKLGGKQKVTINLYIDNKLVDTKTGKAGNFTKKPITLMGDIND